MENTREKYFINRPFELIYLEKDILRLLCGHPNKSFNVYNTNK